MEEDNGTQLSIGFNRDLFDTETIKRMLRHFQVVLENVAADVEKRILDLPLLTEKESRQIMVEWNATKTEYPSGKCFPELFEEQVVRNSESVAVIYGEQQLTYQQLNARSNQLAHYLRKRGVGPEVLVGICVERSLEMLIGLLGILKAGGAYVPLDPGYPLQRVAFMLEDSQARMVLTQERLHASLPPAVDAVCLDTDWERISKESDRDPVPWPGPDNLAYVIFTSGSTGHPKGVQIPHRALTNFLTSMRQELGMTGKDKLLEVTTLSFDIAALELFLPLCVGARLILVSRETAADGTQLAAALENYRITTMQATPATWRILIEAGWQGKSDLKILCGGETLSQVLAGKLLEMGASVWNLYGPTETTIWSLVQQVAAIDDRVIPIGRPIANTRVYVLDQYQQLLPVGVPGELCIGGVGLARGYLNRPELTAQKFITDPFNYEAGSRLYRSGDLARYRADGTIEFLGRIDHQVKIRGFRIECGEIETTLNTHPAVREALVVAREDGPGEKRLVAYVVRKQGQAAMVNELRGYLKQKLPDYMVPASFVYLDRLPLTASGKVDRKTLPAHDSERPDLGSTFVPPRTPSEELLAEIWCELLGLKEIGVEDNFFDLGGHSLLAIQMISRVRHSFQVELPVRRLFETPTIAGLAMAVVEFLVEKNAAEQDSPTLDTLAELFNTEDEPSPGH